MADLPVRDTARPLTTLGAVEPVIHMLCGTDFRLSLSARIEHMFTRERDRRSCSFPACDRAYYAKGLCRPHYTQQLHKRPLKPIRPWPPSPSFMRV
jgi:hypothetical protein